MHRAGLSLSLGYIVVGLIMLSVAFLVIAATTDTIDILDRVTGNQISDSRKELIRGHCLGEKANACRQADVTGTEWAETVTYDGRTCQEWQRRHGIFGGGGGGIPSC